MFTVYNNFLQCHLIPLLFAQQIYVLNILDTNSILVDPNVVQ